MLFNLRVCIDKELRCAFTLLCEVPPGGDESSPSQRVVAAPVKDGAVNVAGHQVEAYGVGEGCEFFTVVFFIQGGGFLSHSKNKASS